MGSHSPSRSENISRPGNDKQDVHVHDHVNGHVEVHVVVDVSGFSIG